MVSFWVRKASTFDCSRCEAAVSFSSSAWSEWYWFSRSVYWVCKAALRLRASRARSSRPAPSACFACPSSLVCCCWSVFICSSTRLREVATSATPRRTCVSMSSWRW